MVQKPAHRRLQHLRSVSLRHAVFCSVILPLTSSWHGAAAGPQPSPISQCAGNAENAESRLEHAVGVPCSILHLAEPEKDRITDSRRFSSFYVQKLRHGRRNGMRNGLRNGSAWGDVGDCSPCLYITPHPPHVSEACWHTTAPTALEVICLNMSVSQNQKTCVATE